ncbi:MAG: hypothetical protein R3223_12235 [Longimicrobiales bacterium]|nr:hypothetical protein [Longimicrobiales bacterium]
MTESNRRRESGVDAGWDRPSATQARERRPPAAYGLLGLVLFQGLSGLAGGFGLLADPSGTSMRIPLEWLGGSPFQSYLIPGIVLFAVLGLFPLVVAYGVGRRRAWAWAGSLAVGLTLIGFLAVEVLVVGFHLQPPLQPIYALVAVGIVLLAMAPSVRGWLRQTERRPVE